MSTLHLVAEAITVQAAGDGLLDFTNSKANEVMKTLQIVSYVAAAAIFLIRSAKGGWTVSGMVVNGLIGVLLVWIVHNVTDLEKRVDNELSAAPVAVISHAASPPGT